MAKDKAPAAAGAAPESIEAALLRDCVFGKCGEVVTLSSADAEQAIAHGMADTSPVAIAAAKG